LTLSAGSMVRYPFGDFVDAAAHAGFAAISVTKRLRYLAHRREHLTDEDMRVRIRERGLRVAEIEGTPGWLPGPEQERDRVLGFDEALRIGTALHATSIVAYHDGRPCSHAAVVDSFAVACDRAAEHGLALALEFLPWTPVPTLGAALAIVEDAGRANGRVLFDSWHHLHGGQSCAALSRIQAQRISCLQLVDARAPVTDDPVTETMYGRRVPGTGTLNLPALVAELAAAGVDSPVSVEVYDETLAGHDARAYASVLAEATRRILRVAMVG
jgi:sugar phosphate isomerase/epimerase